MQVKKANTQTSAFDKKDESYIHFTNDVRPHRLSHWESIFHQIAEPTNLNDVQSVLEFGPGRGLTGAVLKYYGINYYCADVADWGAKPDFISSIKDFYSEQKFDLVCAFQTLEHNPPEDFIPHLKKMAEISNKYVFISLPYSGRWIGCNISINLPKFSKNLSFGFQWPRFKKKKRPIEEYRKSENLYKHHWFEVGDEGYSKKEVSRIAEKAGLKTIKDYHSKSFPYHYFILLEKS